MVTWGRSQDVACVIVYFLALILWILSDMSGIINGKYLIFMSFNAFNLIKMRRVEIMNTNISVPITASNIFAIMREANTSNCLLDVLRFPHHYVIIISIIFTFYLLSILSSLQWLSSKDIKVVRLDFINILYKYYFAHIFTVCISK